ncbi:MAG: TetR/AcrR family transcriptional regulator [Parvibaculum sp.]|uniref:TetR/AcrR family transcriptional regulator n=1 Tax=Parvibaculum sp. TaxID=2024848 RepID=UPI002A35685A|nr:TetR/AcrR family transcriptional regulator [Parvibaculum sp.]
MALDTHRRKISSQKRAGILRSAKKHFLKYGYTSAGMADIARDADVSTATLYKHFSSKEELFAAIVREVAVPAGDYSGAIEAGDTARDILYRLCRIYLSIQFDQQANALMRVVMAEVPSVPQLAADMYEVLGNRRNDSLMAVIDEMIRRGMLKPHDSAFGARLGGGMLKEVFVWPALFEPEAELPPDADEKIHRVIDAYLALYGPDAKD